GSPDPTTGADRRSPLRTRPDSPAVPKRRPAVGRVAGSGDPATARPFPVSRRVGRASLRATAHRPRGTPLPGRWAGARKASLGPPYGSEPPGRPAGLADDDRREVEVVRRQAVGREGQGAAAGGC